jgi:hypothetical protein
MATKKTQGNRKKSKGNNIPNFKGHYCRVCDTYKANEKFSGRGHNAHICKACAAMSPAEQAEDMTINRLYRMGTRYINKEELKWLKNRMKDRKPEVRALACDLYDMKFPHHRRNEIKQTLRIDNFKFRIHSEIMDGYGDEYIINVEFTTDTSGRIVKKIYDENDNVTNEQSVEVGQGKIKKIFNYMVHNCDIYFWDEDLCGKVSHDPDIDILPEYREDDFDEEDEDLYGVEETETDDVEETGGLYWSVDIAYKNGQEQHTKAYDDYVPQEVGSLYDELDFYFPSESDDLELDEDE